MSQKIIPHLWFNKEAKIASEFYTSIFPDSKINHTYTLKNTPSGDCDVVSFNIWNYSLTAISAGPHFKFNPSISFMVNFDPSQDNLAKTRIDEVYAKLMDGGKALMPLDKYPFSERYGWVEDKFGLSWQLILTNPDGEKRPEIIPSLLYVTKSGKTAEEATNFYISAFSAYGGSASGGKNSKRGTIARYAAGIGDNKEGAVMFTDFTLENQWFTAMDGTTSMHKFAFNEAISFMVKCETQKEIDYYWEKLSANPENEQCGWLKDKYGVSWQIVPSKLDVILSKGTREQIDRVTKTFLPMKKLIIKDLEKAFNSK